MFKDVTAWMYKNVSEYACVISCSFSSVHLQYIGWLEVQGTGGLDMKEKDILYAPAIKAQEKMLVIVINIKHN